MILSQIKKINILIELYPINEPYDKLDQEEEDDDDEQEEVVNQEFHEELKSKEIE